MAAAGASSSDLGFNRVLGLNANPKVAAMAMSAGMLDDCVELDVRPQALDNGGGDRSRLVIWSSRTIHCNYSSSRVPPLPSA